ncbi:hypothetical protein LB503_005456 [Fusarium chuoi]|nr:hypothetical protein LB503_005456 [Fusarium chuoi]
MNSKNWNDRADKDLFFTILSVKNIGVISGSEWTTIGNHMRSLGYGFTNEGCRQHFQGLRRAQNKAETAGPNGDIVRRNDPTMNPITRRPGPGRGRPRKQPPVPLVSFLGPTPYLLTPILIHRQSNLMVFLLAIIKMALIYQLSLLHSLATSLPRFLLNKLLPPATYLMFRVR